jgi:hypothetical protein
MMTAVLDHYHPPLSPAVTPATIVVAIAAHLDAQSAAITITITPHLAAVTIAAVNAHAETLSAGS